MAAAEQDFTSIRNDTFPLVSLQIDRNAAAINLTGATIAMMLRLDKASDPVALSLSTATSGITITTAAAGEFAIDKQIIAIDAGVYFYDMQLTEAGGDVTTIMEGTFTITQDVTYT